MDEKRKEIEKQYQKRTRPLLLLTLPLDLIALVLVAYGARVYREGGSPLMQFAGFLLMIAIGATLAIVLRRAARLRQEALDALEREYAANPDADEERIHIPGEGIRTSGGFRNLKTARFYLRERMNIIKLHPVPQNFGNSCLLSQFPGLPDQLPGLNFVFAVHICKYGISCAKCFHPYHLIKNKAAAARDTLCTGL